MPHFAYMRRPDARTLQANTLTASEPTKLIPLSLIFVSPFVAGHPPPMLSRYMMRRHLSHYKWVMCFPIYLGDLGDLGSEGKKSAPSIHHGEGASLRAQSGETTGPVGGQ